MSSQTALELKIVVSNYGHTAALKNCSVAIQGVKADFVRVEPIVAAYRQMVRKAEFDVCELAPTTYFIAKAFGASFKALPIFLMRRFHHAGIVCREDARIKTPKDLEGKKVGVRAYSVTTGVWTRGILSGEYGLDLSKVTWVVDDEEHVTRLRLPANVVKAPAGRSIASMMASGEIHAGFSARAGIGREGPPTVGWDSNSKPVGEVYHDLLENAEQLETEWFHRTGIYPIHGVLVVKEKLLVDYPWLAGSLYTAFTEAKDRYITYMQSKEANSAQDKRYRRLATIVGQDPLPFGLNANLPAIEALKEYALLQGLLPRRLSVEELFVNPES